MKTNSAPWKLLCLTLASAAMAIGVVTAAAPMSAGTTWYVAPGGMGNGSLFSPFGHIQDGIAQAQPGDTVLVKPGVYTEALTTVRAATGATPIVIQSANGLGSVTVTSPGRVLTVGHPGITIAGLVLDGQFGLDDAIRVTTASDDFTLRDSEVRRSGNDLMDIQSPARVTIERVLLHDALNPTGGRTDAHGISAGAVRDMVIRDVEIHTFSGDGIQVDPGRGAPGWDRVTIERARIWLQPLPANTNGFPAGSVPGENAIDTKANATLARATMTIRDVEAYGFQGGFITNMAAFNIKENVDVLFDGVTVHDSEIAFRLRGPGSSGTNGAWVRVQNAVIHDVQFGVRYEDNLQNLRIWNSTFGAGISNAFWAAGVATTSMDVRNVLFLGPLPAQAPGPTNRQASAADFINAAADDYRLSASSAAIDTGAVIAGVTTDRIGVVRPQGSGYDVGAFERPGVAVDVTPPVVFPPQPLTITASEAGGARGLNVPALSAFLGAGTATDNVDPAPIRLAPLVNGSQASDVTLFPIGTTTVTFRFQDSSLNVGTAVSTVVVQPAPAPSSMIVNGDFSAGLSGWQTFATPSMSYIVASVTGGVLQYYRLAPPPGTKNQAVVFQHTGTPIASGQSLVAQFALGNSSTVRKRISVLVLDSDFSDLAVCTFWLPANAPLRTYGMRAHTTKAWANAAMYFYAATEGSNGGAYLVDDVSLQPDNAAPSKRTTCIDPVAPAGSGGTVGPEMLVNGDFGAGMGSWSIFGQLTSQLTSGIFEFLRPVALDPAGVILQPTQQAVAAGETVTALFDLGNSSAVRKRVTVLLHDLDFSDLSACTFWLDPGQPLATYQMRALPSVNWTNATISIYDAVVGANTWTRLDNVSLRKTPPGPSAGTDCIEPGGG